MKSFRTLALILAFATPAAAALADVGPPGIELSVAKPQPLKGDDALVFVKTAYSALSAMGPGDPVAASAQLKEDFDFGGFYARVIPDLESKLKPDEKTRLAKIFEDLFFANFAKKAGNIFARKIENPVYAVRETKAEYVVVTATGKMNGANATFAFFTRPDSWGKSRMIDIEVDSVLLSRNYRGSFNRVFREKGFAGLVEKLEAKLKEASAPATPDTPAK